ncbi:BON domain-containing protein [Metarhizobium album]|uniref:BON domain-containing protein n=1 Tax=Metarhizobium album TaxID=2182425 RepID=A0A2U2DL13_9HYPH|nr:BON domain-containing protein [Rhizobium album]PWE53986.1 BON domain-containing protein [Rhizobium album]
MVFKPATFHELPPTIEVENPTQAMLETAVADALGSDSALDATGVSVVARGATITLSGSVLTDEEVVRAIEVASRIDGVKRVDNRLSAQSPNLAWRGELN